MKQQRGAALVVVLSMLAMSLMLGLSGMQSSLIDERLAGNYKAAAEAQMNAERAVAELYERIVDPSHLDAKEVLSDFNALQSGFSWDEFSDLASHVDYSLGCHFLNSNVGAACFVHVGQGYLALNEGAYIFSMGVSGVGSQSVPIFVLLDIDLWNGFGPPSAVSLPGGIDENVPNNALQWPTSAKSKISGADGFLDEDGNQINVAAMSILQGDGLLNIEGVYEDKANLNEDTVVSLSKEPVAFVSLIRRMYEQYKDAPSASFPGVHFYTGSNQMDFTGNHSLSGIHIVLNGAVQIGGNSHLDGTLIVLNVDDLSAESWSLSPATFVKLNGGGGDGTVWFDSQKVSEALSSFGLTLDDFYGVSAENNIMSEVKGIRSWL
ncbi:hypothetical protein HBJ58_04415 [Halomonas desiderata]|uniref:Type 4 fimbrial biogenesis protein PilX N-terminal domain-containing protein n=1 Tax=Billgrantia desiderata TaxID=52021 RepID=A0ABS9B890_9GAMM|nr:PilX N-terminal domain-containing pilus assembly protein [Halomonas desiderata]MCE8010117.1 hypothetical protein [Halomonas desiderata]MCE8043846.1 hypothetical protein [Halomonas desiderata]MCE8048431.1 hypothetical protein [Halomonas desiderata]NIC35908.1 hypothetical protein [Halomonas desiderata]